MYLSKPPQSRPFVKHDNKALNLGKNYAKMSTLNPCRLGLLNNYHSYSGCNHYERQERLKYRMREPVMKSVKNRKIN